MPDVDASMYALPATSIARNQFSAPIVANIVMLGALTKIYPVAERKCVEDAIAATVPKSREVLNLEAFAAGFDTVAEYIKP
jgi:2-oxoglutarate ferredoxin oxidoreductase subunit gamma